MTSGLLTIGHDVTQPFGSGSSKIRNNPKMEYFRKKIAKIQIKLYCCICYEIQGLRVLPFLEIPSVFRVFQIRNKIK
jgi:hypothetical protein